MSWGYVAIAGATIAAGAMNSESSRKAGNVSTDLPASQEQIWNRITRIADSPTPDIPVKQTAPMSPLEQQSQALAAEYVANPSEETRKAIEELGKFSNYKSTMDVPEYRELYKTLQKDSSSELNRIGRSMRLSGNDTSSSGANVVTQALGTLQSRIMGQMAPYSQDLMTKRMQAPIMAADIADKDKVSRINTGTQVGQLPRALQQLGLDAKNVVDREKALFDYQYRIPAYQSLVGVQGNTIVHPNQSGFAEAAPIMGMGLSAMMNGLGNRQPTYGDQNMIKNYGGLEKASNSPQLNNWMSSA